MLGLGLAISVGKRILGGVIEALMSALRGRAEYSENNTDSKAVVKDIDNYELLDKASILLTPTATSNARVHSVKTYTGDELITNGGFDTDSDWTKGTGWTIANGKASNDGSGGSNNLRQSNILTIGSTYKITITVSDYVSGNVEVSAGASPRGTMSANGTYTFYQETTPSDDFYIIANAFTGSIDNVSVTEADADFDFDRASSATRINSDGLVQDMQSITDPELVLNGDFEDLGDNLVINGSFTASSTGWAESGTWAYGNNNEVCTGNGANQMLTQSGILTNEKFYTYSIDIISSTLSSQEIRVYVGGTDYITHILSGEAETISGNTVSAGSNLVIRVTDSNTSGQLTIDNVSVQQVNVDSEGNDIWTLGTGWSIEDGVLQLTGTETTNANQALGLVEDNIYQVTFTVSETTSGAVRVRLGTGTISDDFTDGTHTIILEHTTSNDALRFYANSSGVFNGKIDNVSVKDITFSTEVDLARINYDSNGDNGHILLEPTSTNLITYSQEFDHSSGYWNTPNTTVETTSITSPDGSNNTYKLFADTGSSSHYLDYDSYSGASSGQTYTFSLFVKSAGSDFVQIASSSGFPARYQNFNLSTGAKASGDISNATIEAYPNGWYRISVTETTNSTSRRFLIVPALTDMARNASFAGNVEEDGVYIFGAQLEQLGYATSLIPTLTGNTVTRATETLTGSGNSTLINSTEGVLYAEIAALAESGLVRYLGLNDGTNDNRVVILNDGTANRVRAIVSSGGTKYADLFYNVTDVTDFHKLAVKYKANDFALWIDGVEIATDTSGSAPIGLNNLEFDLNSGGAFYGKCKALAVFNDALEDDELELLTGVTNYGSFGELASANGYTII